MKISYNINQDVYGRQIKVYGATGIVGLVFLASSLIIAIMAGAVIVWADVLVTLGEILHTFLVFFIAKRIMKENGDSFNFGVERLESLISFLCEMMIMLSLLTLSGIAIKDLIHPEEPENSMIYFLILKVIKTAVDFILLSQQKKIISMQSSRMSITEMETAKHTLVFDFVLCIVAGICYLLREMQWSWYVSPIASIIICIYFIIECIHRIKGVIKELSDMAIPVKDQDAILDIVLDNLDCIKKIVSVDSRLLNKRIYIDVTLEFKDSVSYSDIKRTIAELKKEIYSRYPDCEVRIIIQ